MPEPHCPLAEGAIARPLMLTRAAARVVQELVDEHREVWCDLFPIDERTWAIRGTIAYEGEVILAEFDSRELAEVALDLLMTADGSTCTR